MLCGWGSISETLLSVYLKVCVSFRPLKCRAYHGLRRSNVQGQGKIHNTRQNEYILSQIRAVNVALSLNWK